MRKNNRLLRYSTAAFAALLVTGAAASVASAAEEDTSHGEGSVDVSVEIPEIEQPGVLALSVAGTSTTLSENGSDAAVRQFTGTLPTVTVTDTRSADEVAGDAAWYVLGTSSGFTGSDGQEAITADHLGWTPALVQGDENGLVFEGDPVETVLDSGPNAVGLVDRELLFSTFSSAEVASEGVFSATANLALRTPADVAPGTYTANLTLSLFE
ncbi:hypothetical protein L2X99_09670 [Microbacterium sp. KUDC0406]|uniref:hypothetical protein n=1 Tax=Microbacterium sp. KUDC0406 TaxID=2909588 RepID=UPI001F41918D|nr:hypothetical protein [Microbacterium sp. KUDC0406]UJP08783.1 hypothetical protein L2X99_09670 [Microbacterium sp. KUDC0406]